MYEACEIEKSSIMPRNVTSCPVGALSPSRRGRHWGQQVSCSTGSQPALPIYMCCRCPKGSTRQQLHVMRGSPALHLQAAWSACVTYNVFLTAVSLACICAGGLGRPQKTMLKKVKCELQINAACSPAESIPGWLPQPKISLEAMEEQAAVVGCAQMWPKPEDAAQQSLAWQLCRGLYISIQHSVRVSVACAMFHLLRQIQ